MYKMVTFLILLLFSSTLSSQNIKIQAESGVLTGNAAITDIYTGFDGNGFVGYLTNIDSGVTLNAPVTGGRYKLNLKYSAGTNSGYTMRTVMLKINGEYKRKMSFLTEFIFLIQVIHEKKLT